jgi:hypothetical protein
MPMPSLPASVRGQRRKRLRAMASHIAVIALLTGVAACSDDNASNTASQHQQLEQQALQAQQHPLATSFNADTPKSDPQSPSPSGPSLQTPQFSTARAQSASPSGASAADSVVLAPPVIHTVD